MTPDEDDAPRWINHFYDPTNKVGWSGKHFANLTPAEGLKFGADFAPKLPMASIDWVVSQESQALYGDTQGNQTWQKAVKSFIDGDKKSAFIALGHVLHLLEDASVPDHTRDDTHADLFGDPGSPYEKYSKEYTNLNRLNLASGLKNTDFISFSNIQEAIKSLAVYSNNNFFSEDTISNDEFLLPNLTGVENKIENIDNEKVLFLYHQQKQTYLAILNNRTKNYSTNDKSFVLPSYRDHLFPKAILTGASVINLFFYDVEYYKQHPDQLEPIVPDSYEPLALAIKHSPKKIAIKIADTANRISVDVSKITTKTALAVNGLLGSLGIKLGSATPPAASQSNTELTTPPAAPTPPPEPVKPPVTIVAVSPPKPPAPRPKPIPPPVIVEDVLPPAPPTVVEDLLSNPPPPASLYEAERAGPPRPSGELSQPKPSFILAAGYTPPATPPASHPAEENPVIFPDTSSSAVTSTILTTTTVEIFTTTTSSIPIVIDTAPPSVPILNIQNQTSASSTNILVNMESADELSPPIYFDLEFSTNTTDWISLATSTTSTIYNFFGTRGQKYYFKARATDAVGNISEWSNILSFTFVNWSGEVVINEVAWAGTSASKSNDEWFELYNNTDQEIDLTDWKIFASGQQIKIKINNKNIAPRGYYLLERKEDSVIRDIDADAIFTGSLNNDGEKLEVFNPDGVKIDEVDASGGWFAGDKIKYRSMERLDPIKNGNDPANWQSAISYRPTGINVNYAPVYGSPRQSNFGFLVLHSSQEEDVKTLDIKNSPYVVQYYIIPAGKTLNVEPDVSVLLQTYGGMEVNGSLNALGEEDKRVNFLPYPSSSAWGSLTFNSSTSTLNFVNLKRGNRIIHYPQNLNGMILATNSNLTINNANLWDSETNTIGGTDSTLNISNTAIGATTKVNKTYGINTRGGVLNLDNVNFSNLNIGVEAGCTDCSHPELHKTNMSDANFINVDYIAEPLDWWNVEDDEIDDGGEDDEGGEDIEDDEDENSS